MIDPRQPDYSDTPISDRRPRFRYAREDSAAPPAVSIVTPFFNTREVLHDTVRNMLGQSLQQWEWLIVNDCSTDPAALEVLQQYRDFDPRIQVIDHQTNRGPGAARNTGYRHARAPYVFQMDDDDLMEPTALEKMAWYLESYPEIAVVNGWSVAFGAKEYLWPTGFDRGDDLLHANLATGRALVRKSAHRAAGGFDETIRGGMEDWDFWLRLASAGHWGATIPEYLDWYRRRDDHSQRWKDWDCGDAQKTFEARLREKYPRLYEDGVPRIVRRYPMPLDPIRAALPFSNRLTKSGPRLLLIAPWLAMGGADKVNLDLLTELAPAGWEISIATTLAGDYSWAPEFARYTPDIFVLPNFLAPQDFPVFLRYLIESRRPDVVLLANSELAYLVLPYLRTVCPAPAYVDLCHSESRAWKHGGYPRYAIANQDLLDLSITSTAYLRDWMAQRGGDPQRIEVIYTGVDETRWTPAPDARRAVRARLKIPAELPVILFSGRLHPDKQPRVLAATLQRLVEAGHEFRALVTGDGPERPWLAGFLAEHRLESHVALLGHVPVEEMPALFAAADLFFLPSLWEGIALTLFEAMACGVAVVGADVGAQAELVTPDCGVLIPKGSEDDEIAEYSRRLSALLADPQTRAEMGRRGRERILQGFTLGEFGRRFRAAFDRAVAAHARNPAPRLAPRFAEECATLAVEHMRMSSLLDYYWARTHDEQLAVKADSETVRGLTRERDSWEQEAQRLAKAWNAHVEFIHRLEAENAQLRGLADGSLYVRARRLVGRALRQAGLMRERPSGPARP